MEPAPERLSARGVKPKRSGWYAATLPWVAALSLTGTSLRAQGSPSPITFHAGSWQLGLGGYFKLNLIHDFNAINSPDLFDPRSIPVDGRKGTNTRITARETRLSLGIEGPVEGKDLELFLEGDFFGPSTGTGNAFRLRHAYARYGVLVAGQTWTTFWMSETSRRRWTSSMPWPPPWSDRAFCASPPDSRSRASWPLPSRRATRRS